MLCSVAPCGLVCFVGSDGVFWLSVDFAEVGGKARGGGGAGGEAGGGG